MLGRPGFTLRKRLGVLGGELNRASVDPRTLPGFCQGVATLV
jgi:hypothetical protein